MQAAQTTDATGAPGDGAHPRPRVVVAGEFSAGKSSLINLLMRRALLTPSIGLSVHPPIRLRHGSEQQVMEHHWDGSVRPAAGVAEAAANPEVAEVALALPFDLFPGVEMVELPPPNGSSFLPAHTAEAAGADLLIWCTIASQAWRLTEKECMATLGRGPDQPTILAVMRDDLIRSGEDRAKINRRLETEARPFFTDIVFVAASTQRIEASADDTIWTASGGDALGRAISALPGAMTAPVAADIPKSPPVVVPLVAEGATPEPAPGSALVSAAQAEAVATHPPEPPKAPETTPLEDMLDTVLGAVSGFPGYRHAAVISGSGEVLSHNLPGNNRTLKAARILFLTHSASFMGSEKVEELMIRGKNGLHLLWDIGDGAYVHLVMHANTTTLSAVKTALREAGAQRRIG